jgi:hypothetical protein
MGESEESLLGFVPANVAVQAVSLYQVSYAELPEPARAFRLSRPGPVAVCRRSAYVSEPGCPPRSRWLIGEGLYRPKRPRGCQRTKARPLSTANIGKVRLAHENG